MMDRRDCGQRDEIEVTSEVMWALAKETNRHVVRYFDETGRNPTSVDDLAEYLAERSTERLRNDLRGARIHLHHASLPALDDIGIVDYDVEEGVVRKPKDRALPTDFMEHVFALDDDD